MTCFRPRSHLSNSTACARTQSCMPVVCSPCKSLTGPQLLAPLHLHPHDCTPLVPTTLHQAPANSGRPQPPPECPAPGRFHREYGTQRSSRLTFFEEKLGFREAFRGNKFTVHGTKNEPLALDAYRKLSLHTVQVSLDYGVQGSTVAFLVLNVHVTSRPGF